MTSAALLTRRIPTYRKKPENDWQSMPTSTNSPNRSCLSQCAKNSLLLWTKLWLLPFQHMVHLASAPFKVTQCNTVVDSVDKVTQLAQVVDRLVERVEKLHLQRGDVGQPTMQMSGEVRRPMRGRRRRFTMECWNCLQPGHLARNTNHRTRTSRETDYPRRYGPSVGW